MRLSLGRHCPSGQILRKAYTTKRGVHVKAGCVLDRGRPGKGPKTLPKPRRGALKGWKKANPVSKNRAIIKKIAKKEGCNIAIWRLNHLANLTADRATKSKARADMKWIQSVCRGGRLGATELIELG